MNVGITCYPTYGGSGIVASELGKELAHRGHTIHFIATALPTRVTELSDRIHFHEVEMLDYPLFEYLPYDLALATKQAEVAEEFGLDLLHVHYAIPHSISAFLAREMLRPLRYLPVITTLHGTDITLVGRDRSYLKITRFGIDQSDGVTAVSNYLRAATCDTFGLCDLRVIPNFINGQDYQRRPCEPRRSKYASPEEKVIVHVSNFRPLKRAPDCVEIFARLAHRVPSQLLMIGDGPDRAHAEWLAAKYGLSDRVHFVGKQPQIVDFFSIADLFLLPSEMEAFGLAALEAMACEVPVVVSRTGGLLEVVEDGDTGFLVEVGDIDGMADAALRVLTDDALGRRLGRKAREAALQRYAHDKIIPLYEQFYREILEKSGARPVQ